MSKKNYIDESEILKVLYESDILNEDIKNIDGEKISEAIDEIYRHFHDCGYSKEKTIPCIENLYSEMLNYAEEMAKHEFKRGFYIAMKILRR